MYGTVIESVLTGKLDWNLLSKWLNNESIEGAPEDCVLFCLNRREFVAYFLSYLRNQTVSILQTNSNALSIPQHKGKPDNAFGRNHHRSISDPTCDNDKSNDSLIVKSERRTPESPNRDKKKQGRRVKTKLFTEEKKDNVSLSSDECRISTGVDRIFISTPMKNGFRDYPSLLTSPVTPQSRSFKESERCDTPRYSRHSRCSDKSVSLADYLVNVQPKSSKKRRSKNTSNDDSETKIDLDLSNSDVFPEIGARKSSSLKCDRRRIKPTSIDISKKSCSLNSFTSDTFQQPALALEENLVFNPKSQPKETSNSIEVERNILKQERHKVMEKFNILNTTNCPKVTPPQIKIMHREDISCNCIEADVNQVVHNDKIDTLTSIYSVLLKNNLILSMNTEIYYLITILLSKQIEDDFFISENQLQTNVWENILKIIHNSTYFAIKSLWNQRSVLEVILDKNSLKILGENKKVRSFYPDLAKFLLNSYGLKCEAESNRRKNSDRYTNGMVCFNHETDNVDNFPSVLSFQNFKKQRDMFHEILRWYQDNHTTLSRSVLRARIRTLLWTGASASNYAHLATLFTHMLLETLPPNEQELKLSKLQRRLTCPTTTESHRLPQFSHKEIFYKEFILYAENESFRVHLRDAFASEIIILDSTPLGNESSNGTDTSKEFLQLSKKLGLLGKFLGFVTSLPYIQIPIDILLKSGVTKLDSQDELLKAPKEKVLENNIALRDYSRPIIDVKGLLVASINNNRLIITLPWIVHYLSMLDYTSLRLKYYQNLFTIIFHVHEKLYVTDNQKNIIIYLKSILGWLFDLPHFPQELFYVKRNIDILVSYDLLDLAIDESILFELCPFLRDLSVLLSTSRVNEKESITFRHITPVSLSFNSEDRIRNKEKELQLRLEEQLVKSQAPSTRRVLELVAERVAAAVVRELPAALVAARRAVRRRAAALLAADRNSLPAAVRALYQGALTALLAEGRARCVEGARARAGAALGALLPAPAPAHLRAVAARAAARRALRWLDQHWVGIEIFCKNFDEEINNLLLVGDVPPISPPTLSLSAEFDLMQSPAQTIIDLKEQICLLLDNENIEFPVDILKNCVNCCSNNNVFSRPPAQRALLQLSVDFCIVYVSRKPSQISDVLPHFHLVWDTCCPGRGQQNAADMENDRRELSPRIDGDDGRAKTPVSGEDKEVKVIECQKAETKTEKTEKVEKSEPNGLLEYFERILCPRNIVLLNASKCKSSEVWESLSTVMVFLLKNSYLSEDSLTEQCLAVYRQDWPQNVLENLSTCMKSVSAKWCTHSAGKFNLFLDFLADYCNDIDYDLVE